MITQIAILSGKGGSGKTSFSAALAPLITSRHNLVLVDADVDASNLHLVISHSVQTRTAFWGGKKTVIDQNLCTQCGLCENICHFHAIQSQSGEGKSSTLFTVNPMQCEGCTLCALQCPTQAIHMEPHQDGWWYFSQTKFGDFFHAHLFPGHENSGKLVSTIIDQARSSVGGDHTILLVDGPPGIGCPVIAASTQSDIAVLVIEPTLSGIHDMQRIADTTRHFHIPSYVVLNKADLDENNAATILEICARSGIPVLGNIPFDETFTEAMLHAQPLTQYAPDSLSSKAVQKIWHNLEQVLKSR